MLGVTAFGTMHQSAEFIFLALFDQAVSAPNLDAQTKALQAADVQLGKDVAYIPLEIAVFNWVHGSKVTGFSTSSASSSFVELGAIDVDLK